MLKVSFDLNFVSNLTYLSILTNFNHIAYIKTERITVEELKNDCFKKKVIPTLRRLRQVWVDICGFWFFKDIDIDVAKHQIIKIEEDMKTDEDVQKFMAKLSTYEFDRKKPLWYIFVKEDYDKNTSILFSLVNHMLSDGMGIVSLFMMIDQKPSSDLVNTHRQIPFFLYYILPLLYLPKRIFQFFMTKSTIKGDPKMFPFHLNTGKQSRNKIYLFSKFYKLEDLRKCYNKFGKMKLNDYMLA